MKWIQAVVAVGALVVGIVAVTPMAAQPVCLHGTGEIPEQAARRKQALSLAREIHNQQHKAFQSAKAYLPAEKLAEQTVPDGFEMKLITDGKGYAFSVVDKSDPCKFGYFSNDAALIYRGEVTR